MTDKLVEGLKNLETHADVLMKIPSSEQCIGNIQAVVSVAILDIKRCLEELALRTPEVHADGHPGEAPLTFSALRLTELVQRCETIVRLAGVIRCDRKHSARVEQYAIEIEKQAHRLCAELVAPPA